MGLRLAVTQPTGISYNNKKAFYSSLKFYVQYIVKLPECAPLKRGKMIKMNKIKIVVNKGKMVQRKISRMSDKNYLNFHYYE